MSTQPEIQLIKTEISDSKFTTKRKWFIPKGCFIVTTLPLEEWEKLKKWKDHHDELIIDATANRELLILNETKLNKRRHRKDERELQNKS